MITHVSMLRFTRFANSFSKKIENLGHAVAPRFIIYDCGRIHQAHRILPAMR